MPNIAGALAGLAGFPQGLMEAQRFQQDQAYRQALMELNQQALADRRRAALLEQQQQQALSGVTPTAIANLFGGGGSLPALQQQAPDYSAGAVARQPLPDLATVQGEIRKLESGGRDYAPTSPTGAMGVGQVMPATAAQYGVPNLAATMAQARAAGRPDPTRALGDRIVGDLSQRFPGRPDLVAAGYNAGPGAAARYAAGGALPRETQNYVARFSADLGLDGTHIAAAQPVARAIAPIALPQAQQGNWSQVAQMIEQANPDLPMGVKTAAFLKLVEASGPIAQRQFEQGFKMWEAGLRAREETQREHHQEVMEQQGAQREADLVAGLRGGGTGGWQVVETPGGQPFRLKTSTGETAPIDLPAGTTKMGSSPIATGGPEITAPEKWEGMPDQPPPGISPTIWNGALAYVQTGQMPSLGFQPGIRNQIMQAAPIAMKALGIKPSEAPQIWAQYGGQKHAEFALGTRIANLSTSIFEAQKAAPVVIAASQGVPRTGLGPFFNRWITGTELQSGDPKIVQFQAALNAFLNMYARGINPTGRLTDQQQQHAYEVLNTAMSKGQIEAGVGQLQYELQLMQQGLGEAVQQVPKAFRGGGEAQPPSAPGAVAPPAAAEAAPTMRFDPDSGELVPITPDAKRPTP